MGGNGGGGDLFAQISSGYVSDPRRGFLEIGIFFVDQRGERDRSRAAELTEALKGRIEDRRKLFRGCGIDIVGVHANAPDCGGMAVGNSPRRGRSDTVLPTIRTGNLGKIASDDFFGERYVGQIHHDQRPAVSGLSSSKTEIGRASCRERVCQYV